MSGESVTLIGSALSMGVGVLVLLRQTLLVAYGVGGWTAVGVLFTLIAVMLFALHIWLDEQIPHWKYEYGR